MPQQRRRAFLRRVGAVGSLGVAALAGCLGDDGDDTGSDLDDVDDEDVADDPIAEEYDFGGESMDALVGVSPAIGNVHHGLVIPEVERKYNLEVNMQQAATGQIVSTLEANPDDPPDVLGMNTEGIHLANENDWLETLDTDIVDTLDQITPELRWYDDVAASWYVGEQFPIVNTDVWGSPPTSWEEAVTESETGILMAPFIWTQGTQLLLASVIAAGGDYGSRDLDIDAGFEWLENTVKPNVFSFVEGPGTAQTSVASGAVDTIWPGYNQWVWDMVQEGLPVMGVSRPDPHGVFLANSVTVPKEGDVTKGMLYAREMLSQRTQERLVQIMGAAPTMEGIDIPEEIVEAVDPPTVEHIQNGDVKIPDYGFMWDNMDDWGDRWNQIFAD